jgi:serine/threonine protein kinase
VKLSDLGLAKFFGQCEEATTDLTRSGAVLGTIDYMAPEQAEDAKRADTRSDIYSLGCTLYKCLTGRAPFEDGTHVQKILAHRQEEPDPIPLWNPDVPADLAKLIVNRMMAKSRADRFQTPAEVAAALLPWAQPAGKSRRLKAVSANSSSSNPSPGSDRPPQPESTEILPDTITVACSVCGTRLSATRAQFGTKLECPDCGTSIPVPWPRQPKSDTPKPPEISTYDVMPFEPNPVLASYDRPDYDLQGPEHLRNDKPSGAQETPGRNWMKPLLLLCGVVLGAGFVLVILALLGMLHAPSKPPSAIGPQNANPVEDRRK